MAGTERTLSLQGLVDLDAEISKCAKKLDVAQIALQKIIKVESQADYEATVPENVRAANDEKASGAPCPSRADN